MIDGKMEERRDERWEGRGKEINKKSEKKRKVEKVEEMRGKFSTSRSVKNIKSEKPKILKK